MKQEEKELLLIDLCARLPHRVKVKVSIEEVEYDAVVHGVYTDETVFVEQNPDPNKVHHIDVAHVSEVKPYLFPLSSMTEEQLYELRELFGFEIEFFNGFIESSSRNTLEYLEMVAIIEWFNKNHFDYRGLIDKGLALDATGLNIY